MRTKLLPLCSQQGVCMHDHMRVIGPKQSGEKEALVQSPDDVCEVKV